MKGPHLRQLADTVGRSVRAAVMGKLYKTAEPIEMLLRQTHVVPGLQRLAVAKVNARKKALTFDSQR